MNGLQMAGHQDDNFFISDATLKKLPEDIRKYLEEYASRSNDLLSEADGDIDNLIRLGNCMLTVSSLGYIYHRLRTAEFKPTMEAVFEQEMLTTAFVVTYSRLFVDGKGASGISRKKVPLHLRAIHDELINVRHERYAHNGGHKSLQSAIEISFDDQEVNVSLKLGFELHLGGRNEWHELVKFINEYTADQLQKILERLKVKTGYEWKFPMGGDPDYPTS
ncbi:hypothetical protein F3J34_10685 [Klebsiella sp. Ap-873]|nr:hypothetical protein [Klebsiella sp. Ap-873]